MLRLLLRYHSEMKIDFVNRDNTDSSVCIAPTHWPPSGYFFLPLFGFINALTKWRNQSLTKKTSLIKKNFQEMKLFTSWLLAGVALGQEEYSDYPDYAYEYNNGQGARPPTTTSSGGTTTQPTTADYTTTEAAPPAEYEAEPEPEADMANDFVPAAEAPEEPEEVAEGGDAAGLGRLSMDEFWFPVGKNEDAETPAVYVPPISRLDGELLADGDVQLIWDLNQPAHSS